MVLQLLLAFSDRNKYNLDQSNAEDIFLDAWDIYNEILNERVDKKLRGKYLVSKSLKFRIFISKRQRA